MYEMFKSVLDAERAPVVLCDLEHTIVYLNKTAIERYAKYGGESLLGKSLLKCHNDKSNEAIVKIVEWFKESKSNNIIYTSRIDKENKDVYMIALRNKDGNLIGYYEKHESRDREKVGLYETVIGETQCF